MIPPIVEQYIQRLLDSKTNRNEKENIRYVLNQIRTACDIAIAKHDGFRAK